MLKHMKKQSGITLIALVISVIVMLILAGISLNATVGENGILKQAQDAKLAQESAEWRENSEMILSAAVAAREEIESLTEEEKHAVAGDSAMLESLKKQKMKNYLEVEFKRNNEGKEVIITVYPSGYLIVVGEQALTINDKLEITTALASGEGTGKTISVLVETNKDWLFESNGDGTATLKAYSKELTGTIKIPSVVVDTDKGDAYVVSALGDDLFNYATRVTKIDFSSTEGHLTKIGARAFAFCSNLEIIVPDNLPNSIKTIGDKAFYGCKKLEGNITTITEKGITLGKGVFMNCPNISGDIQSVFDQNFFLENGIPTATVVETGQYSGFSGLTGTLTIPNFITEIKENAFYGCSGITGLNFEQNSKLTTIGNSAFHSNSGIANKVIIPNSVTTIGDNAFYGCTTMSGLQLPSNITNIGSYAFYNCKAMTGELVIPDTITIIKSYSFYQSGITSLKFNYNGSIGCKSIDTYAFERCSSLQTITFPETLTNIYGNAFAFCSKLTNLTLPNSLQEVGSAAFRQCTKMDVVSWSQNLKKIDSSSFMECTSLINLPDRTNLVSIASQAFYGCTNFGKNTPNIIQWLEGSKITFIGDLAFFRNRYLTGNYNKIIKNIDGAQITLSGSPFTETAIANAATIPANGITEIAAEAYAGVNKFVDSSGNEVTEIVIPNTVTTIGASAFKGCSSITKVTIPKSVTKIGNSAFSTCTNLIEIYFEAGSKITEISQTMCYRNSKMTTINIPNTVTAIKYAAFDAASSLKNIQLPDGITEIGDWGLNGCPITEINLTNSLKKIGLKAFSGTKLTEVVIPDSVTSIGKNAFQVMPNLTKVTIGSGITAVPQEMFTGCSKLQTVNFRGTINTISSKAFYNCSSLSNLSNLAWNNVTSIGAEAFYNCKVLTGDAIVNSNCSIDETAFNGCPFVVSK